MTPLQRELAHVLAKMLVAEARKSLTIQADASPTVVTPRGRDRRPGRAGSSPPLTEARHGG